MTTLEPPFALDGQGMLARVESAPAMIRAALAVEAWSPPAMAPDLLAVGGMGGSAIAADLVAAATRDRLPQPMLVVRDYVLPACVTPRSLALLASYSGGTEETLALAAEVARRGVPWVALSTGGALAQAAARAGVPCRPLPAGMSPRAALYAAWVMVSRLVESLGWLDGAAAAWSEAAERLERDVTQWGGAAPESGNLAKQLARRLDGRLVFVYAEPRLEPLATRWRNQINENAKLLGHSAALPELNHNEVVGWERPGRVEACAAVVLLRDGLESPALEARLALTAELLGRRGVPVLEPPAPAGGATARAASLALLGDCVSVYLAVLNGVDPTPIASLDEFKRRLAARRSPAPVGDARRA